MKTEDIKRLKEICKREGFKIQSFDNSDFIFEINKKDPWDGVEFAKGLVNIEGHLEKNRCFRVIKIAEKWNDGHKHVFFYQNGKENYTHTSNVTPATESEYVEQLVLECDNRLGENYPDQLDYSELGIYPIEKKTGFVYNKIHDSLHWCGVPVYCAGKWAKVKENGCMSYPELSSKIYEWADQRGLIKPDNHKNQALKMVSEVGELCDAIIKDDQNGIVDGIGDTLVTLIILSEQLNLSLLDCLNEAYKEIKDREGKTVNGTFIKNKPSSNWCQSCNQVFSDAFVDGKCSECR